MAPEGSNLPLIIGDGEASQSHDAKGPQAPPRMHVTSVRISGGFAWLLVVPVVVLAATLAAFGLAAAGVLGLVAAPWIVRRHRYGAVTTRDGDRTMIELDSEAYRRVDVDGHR